MSASDFSAEETKQLHRAFSWCCRLLGQREYASRKLALKLREKGYAESIIVATLELLQEEGWQSDKRFTESFVRSRIARGQGETRIRFELGQWIKDASLVNAAIEEESPDWQHLCEQALERKAALTANDRELSLKERAKLHRFLQYRGFDGNQIRIAMNRLEKARGNKIENDQ